VATNVDPAALGRVVNIESKKYLWSFNNCVPAAPRSNLLYLKTAEN